MATMDPRGKIIRDLRKALGWNMEKLAEMADTTASTISRLEAGKMPNASVLTIRKIARALGVTVDDLCPDEVHAVLA